MNATTKKRKLRNPAAWSALAVLWVAAAAPDARAGDCAPVIAALKATAKTPYDSTATGTDAHGQAVTVHTVQMPDAKYVERGGKWYRLGIGSKELIDNLDEKLKTAKMDCSKVGSETIDGRAATVYTEREESDGTVVTAKLWVSSQDLLLKAESDIAGRHTVSVYGYENVKAPADAVQMGGR